jgi:hypothetical protein
MFTLNFTCENDLGTGFLYKCPHKPLGPLHSAHISNGFILSRPYKAALHGGIYYKTKRTDWGRGPSRLDGLEIGKSKLVKIHWIMDWNK